MEKLPEFEFLISKFATNLESHKSQIPDFLIIFNLLDEHFKTLLRKRSGSEALDSCVSRMILSINELNGAIFTALQRGLYTSVDSLSRISMEHAVNLMYILKEDSINRANAFILNYINAKLKKASAWYEFTSRGDAENSVLDSIKIQISAFKKHKTDLINNLGGRTLRKWPDTAL